MGFDKPPATKIQEEVDVAASLKSLNSWPQKRDGYFSLCSFFLFVLLYLIIISLQLHIGDGYKIGSGMENQFRIQNNLDGVLTQADFWQYLISDSGSTGLMNIVFDNDWYNGQNFSSEEQGYLLNYDKLVGGLLIVQQRGDLETDGCVSRFGSSSYNLFYPNCYTEASTATARNVTDADLRSMNPNPYVYDGTTYNGFAAFFGIAAGAQRNLDLVRKLRNNLWTDKQTRMISIKFAIYNGNLNAFTFVKIDFRFNLAGVFSGGNHIEYQSIQMEPYRTSGDTARLVLEIIFMILVSFQIWDFLFSAVAALRNPRSLDPNEKYFFNGWSLIDAINLSLLVIFIVLRVLALWMIYKNPITVPTTTYQTILEEVASIQDAQRIVIFLTIICCLLRLHKYYQFQDRLALLNNTFGYAFSDLYHFIIMFAVIFGGFSVMAHFLFGLSLQNYNSIGHSLETLWQMFIGSFQYAELDYTTPGMAGVFFVAFMFLVFMVLMNVFVAILINAYSRAKEESNSSASVFDEISLGVARVLSAARQKTFDDEMLIQGLEQLQAKGFESVPFDHLVGMAGVDVKEETIAGLTRYPGIIKKNREVVVEEAVSPEQQVLNAIKAVIMENDYLKQKLMSVGDEVPVK